MSDFHTLDAPALKDGQDENSAADYSHAWKTFESSVCNNLDNYHDSYLATDVLLLACVFEEFRIEVIRGMNNAFLKMYEADIQLLTNRTPGNGKLYPRGRFSNLRKGNGNSQKLVRGRTCLCQASTLQFMLHADKLYGRLMQTGSLPLKAFSLNTRALKLS